MITSTINIDSQVQAEEVRFEANILCILLSDGAEVAQPKVQVRKDFLENPARMLA